MLVTSNSTCLRLTPGSLMRTSASVPRPTTSPGGVSGCLVLLISSTAFARRTCVWVALLCTRAWARLRIRNRPVTRSSAGSNAIGDRAGEHVALRVGVVLDLVGQLVGERGVVGRQPLEVARAQLDVEVVGHHPPLAGEDLGVVVALALEGRRDLHRLDRRAEGAREGAGDHALEPLLEPLESAHVASFRGVSACWWQD